MQILGLTLTYPTNSGEQAQRTVAPAPPESADYKPWTPALYSPSASSSSFYSLTWALHSSQKFLICKQRHL